MPERPPRVVVANTTPLIALALISRLDLLPRLYGQVVMPPAVWDEISAGGSAGIGIAEVREASWLRKAGVDVDRHFRSST